ncbi:MarR family winged helix-turn-helix transcriptional regulator [Hyalangium minutum]|uniref:Transcriptional regulator, MarR family protein n=1 Tax=Hyalangium minutum TaxID=394096 RepID=A0A085W7T3_9BACT|nr:MarR family transcriptional regulator [Hyalangium minutum]KFE63746.1 Transcriptional regulator, MarR family protein [Hyalangium minutum]
MSTTSMPEPMAKRLGYALKRAQHALRTRMDDALRPLGLTSPQYAVLSAVELEPGMSNARLARAAFVTPQTMQGILANLERDGLLVRQADPEHGRILRSELTSRGKAVLARAHWAVEEVENAMISSLGTAEAARIATLLAQCADALSSTDPD